MNTQIKTFLRFDSHSTRMILKYANVVKIESHHITVDCKLTNINGLVLYQAMTANACIVDAAAGTVRIGLSLSQLTYLELLSQVVDVIQIRKDGVPEGSEVWRTANPHLFAVTSARESYYVIRKTPYELPVVQGTSMLPEHLKKMLDNHDWYYGYSDSLEVYKNGNAQRLAILDELRKMPHIADVDEEYRRLGKQY